MRIKIMPRIAGLVCVMTAGSVLASGIAVDELSVRRMGDGYSGGAAEAADASAVWYNPAAIGRLQRAEFIAGLSAVPHDLKYQGRPRFLRTGTEVSGHNKTWSDTAFIPNIYLALPLAERWWLGFGVNSPWGTGTRFDRVWTGRYQSVESTLLTVAITTAVSWQMSESLLLGLGIITQHADGKVSKALPLTGEVKEDGLFEGAGDDVSFGALLGVHYQPSAGWQLGLSYRGPVRHKLDGYMKVTLSDRVANQMKAPKSEKVDASLKLDIPESVEFSVIRLLTPDLFLKADISWTRWSRFKQLRFTPKKLERLNDKPVIQEMDWHNTWRFALGLEYQLNDRWQLRTGFSADKAAVPAHTATVDFALNDYRALAIGATWKICQGLALDMGAQHTRTTRRHIHEQVNNIAGSPAIDGSGKVINRINSLGMAMRWRF